MKRKYFLNLLKGLNPVKNKPFNTKKDIVIEMLEKVIDGEELTLAEQYKLVCCIHVSALTGKLEDIYSVSSSVAENDACKARAKNCNSICHECYAAAAINYRSNLKLSLLINHIILNCFDISPIAWQELRIPVIIGKSRIESHGDVASVTAAGNMNKIVATHKFIDFGVWTKNTYFWYLAFEKYGKPENMVFIVSSDRLNTVLDVPEYIKPYVDHVFTVFDFETVKRDHVEIQCGYHHCNTCLKCYTIGNTDYYINEILKKDTKKYKKYMGIE